MGAVTGLGLGLVGVAGTGTAAAEPVEKTLKYDCTYPLIGKRTLDLKIKTAIPKKIKANSEIPTVQVNWDAALGADTTEGLQAVDGVKIGGTAVANVKLVSPDDPGGFNVVVDNQLKNTAIPANGGFTIPGYGESIGPEFIKPGSGHVELGNLALRVTVSKTDGNSSALGTFNAPCTVVAGQDTKLADFEVIDQPVTYDPLTPKPTWYPETLPKDANPGTLNYAFNLSGESFIKNANGKVPLTGDIKVAVDGKTGAITGPLNLKKTSGQMSILGFLPVTAEVDFEQTGPTTGMYANGEISTTSPMYIKLPSFKVFGAIPIGGGANCKTTEVSQVKLNSPAGKFFNPKTGGTLATKDYKISAIKDCGPLEGIIGLFASGTGNTIDLNLKP
ncbi:DUF6801 domain-containing protein [Actinomadura fulvescens]|uniref:DUF6801 domain-containing protein n=1 Tax=Actinomadura fulvescens TaxID=46160 RepID=A0ABN3PH08_9ACTN